MNSFIWVGSQVCSYWGWNHTVATNMGSHEGSGHGWRFKSANGPWWNFSRPQKPKCSWWFLTIKFRVLTTLDWLGIGISIFLPKERWTEWLFILGFYYTRCAIIWLLNVHFKWSLLNCMSRGTRHIPPSRPPGNSFKPCFFVRPVSFKPLLNQLQAIERKNWARIQKRRNCFMRYSRVGADGINSIMRKVFLINRGTWLERGSANKCGPCLE